MISESASEQSNMSPSPPASKTKLSIKAQDRNHHDLNSNKVNKKKSNCNESNESPEAAKDEESIISHKNKCPNGNNAAIPLKKIKKEKKRYQELVIDGFTITAFRTWEDLQDEMNERISANIHRNAQNNVDANDMPNTSCSGDAANSLTATRETFQEDNATTSLLHPKQSPRPTSSGVEAISRAAPEAPMNAKNANRQPESEQQQYRPNRHIDDSQDRSLKPQFESQQRAASHSSQPAISMNYPRRSPSPIPQPPPSQTAHQYFQQYQQLYQQMHNSAQQHHHYQQQQQPQPHPHLQNPYLALMNFTHGGHLKGPGPPPPPLPPPPPPPAMPMPNPASMMGPSPFHSPYTITDTIISRQTSIIPSSALPTMPGSLEHLASSRFGRNPHLSALDNPMIPPAFGSHHTPNSYMPSPTERSFMEFARNFANASNMSSNYGSLMNHATMPKNNMSGPNLYGNLERMTLDQQHRAMIQGFGSGVPDPFSRFNPAGRPPTISMFPPHYYP